MSIFPRFHIHSNYNDENLQVCRFAEGSFSMFLDVASFVRACRGRQKRHCSKRRRRIERACSVEDSTKDDDAKTEIQASTLHNRSRWRFRHGRRRTVQRALRNV